ncbi:hypothetical protein GCM10010270_44670 [Streptomyces violaceus]|nr:hypothetical protein GCM10010270_44670 [Streptomyces janthinus]
MPRTWLRFGLSVLVGHRVAESSPHPASLPHRRLSVVPEIPAVGPSVFVPSTVRTSPATSPQPLAGTNAPPRPAPTSLGKKFLSESLTHSQPLRTLCQQALT